jgi:hypothetical protein
MPDAAHPRLPDGLPPGRWVSPDPAFTEGITVTGPALWVSDHPIPDAGPRWGRLLAAQPGTGLWPLLLTGLPRHPDRPWRTGELRPAALPAPGTATADNVFARLWDSATGTTPNDFDWGDAAPFPAGPWPGLPASTAPTGYPVSGADSMAQSLGSAGDRMIGLVPAGSGSAALAACGWLGAANHAGTADIAVAVGSREERFGARLVGAGFNTLELSVAAPPTTLAAARQVAAEHYAACPDNTGELALLDEYAAFLVNRRQWHFWWD